MSASNDHSVSTKRVFNVSLIQVPEAAHTHFHFSIADELSWTSMPALPQNVLALNYEQFSSSCTSSCCLSGFNLGSTDIPGLRLDAAQFFFVPGATAPGESGPPHYLGFTITFRHTTIGGNPLDEWSARSRDLYMTTHNAYKRERERHRCPLWDSNPQSQQAKGHRPAP